MIIGGYTPNEFAQMQDKRAAEAAQKRNAQRVIRLARRRLLTHAPEADRARLGEKSLLLQVAVLRPGRHDDLPGLRLDRSERKYLAHALRHGDLVADEGSWIDGVFCYRVS